MRIAVTGGAGRLGRSVVAGLAEAGHDVVSIDVATGLGMPGRQVTCDLTDREATESAMRRIKPDAVVHLAAIAVPFAAPEHELLAINTGIAMSVLDAVLAVGCPRLLVASSPTVIGYGAPTGWTPEYLPIDEHHPVAPWNAYALSKVAIEEMVAMVARREAGRLRISAFRPCFVIAPEEWSGAPTQQGHTVAERLADPALSAVALFNYVDARDAAEFVRLWLTHDDAPNGSVYFVGAADSLVREPVSDALARHIPNTADAAAGLNAHTPVFSSKRAQRELGWTAKRSWRTELSAHDTIIEEGAGHA